MATDRILIVDDEADIVDVYTEMLKRAGFAVRSTCSGLEAVELCRQEPFDLLLIDLKLPDIGGLEVLHQVKPLLPDAAAIIITAYATLESAVEALRLGAREFIFKPFESQTLIAKVRQILAHRQKSATLVKGNLRTMSLPSIVSINCNEGNQAHLTIRHQGQQADIFFEHGNIVHMSLNGREGEEVIHEVLSWEEGAFELEQGIPPPKRTVTTSWSALLLRGLQHLDESAHRTAKEEEGITELSEKTGMGDMVQHLATDLRKLEGVEGAVIVACDGTILAHDLERDAEKEGAVAVFVGNAAIQIGEALALGSFERGVVDLGSARMLVLGREDSYIGLLLEERASPTVIASQAKTILK